MDTVGPDSDVVSSKTEVIFKYFQLLEIVMYNSIDIFMFANNYFQDLRIHSSFKVESIYDTLVDEL